MEVEEEGDEEDEEEPPVVEEQDEGFVEEELAEVRDLLALDPTERQEYFVVRVLGGRWTKEHTGEVADYVMAKARGGLADEWARAVGFPRSRRFSMNRHTAEGARELAKELARRGDFFCSQYYDGWTAAGPFKHSAASHALYSESGEYLDWACSLDIDGPCFVAVVELQQICPAEA